MDMTFDTGAEEELRRLKKGLRLRSCRQIFASMIAVLLILLLGWKAVLPAVEQQYWDPTRHSYLESVTDLELTMAVYTELFGQGQILMSSQIRKTGFAAYEIDACFLKWSSLHRLSDLSYRSAAVRKGQWSAEANFWNELAPGVLYRDGNVESNELRSEKREAIRTQLQELPEYVQILAAVTFPEDLTPEDFLAVKADHHGNSANFIWAAVRTETNTPALGIRLTEYQSGHYEPDYWDGTEYPQLFPERDNWTAEDMEAHFLSMLRFCRDRVALDEGITPSWTDEGFYERTLAELEESGVRIYGCYLIATPQVLLELLETGTAAYIDPAQCWIGF